ncbi:MAG: hypothetical protein LBC71_01230 [Oscillospiraceae bacterium]|jgi:hypothetical protein|nr:hypothetical protein [Oscillospiraceae bacterium]
MMNNKDTTRKNIAQQAVTTPSHYELSRAHFRMGARESINKFSQLSANAPESRGAAAVLATRTVLAGTKSYTKSAYHAGMGMMEGFMKQHPDSSQYYDATLKNAIVQGRKPQNSNNKGIESIKRRIDDVKVNNGKSTIQTSNNKGIGAIQNKLSSKETIPSKKQLSNQGIKSFRSKTSGQSSVSTKNNKPNNSSNQKKTNGQGR